MYFACSSKILTEPFFLVKNHTHMFIFIKGESMNMQCQDMQALITLNIIPLLAAFFLSLDAKKKLVECALLPLGATTIMGLASLIITPHLFMKIAFLKQHHHIFVMLLPLVYMVLGALGIQKFLKLKKVKEMVIVRSFTLAVLVAFVLQMASLRLCI